ncbi:ABC1 kinase family protein [Pseudoxanthomonas sacheonensis]|uniref:ABC1 kinase family protein n=1 Tax=Pseudoxanthomonas sacheonensis TaxID=443615 RepID=UPI0013D0B233|nr:AarF/UbiB family protein [Pseudoxanthomonas sacheonensis]KAF1710721.1 ubiquinone biosynthesis protein UbiB [Pseudoxanthomonas sacheonensis]
MWETLIASHDLGRLQTLAAILVRYGFGDMVNRLGLAQALTRVGKVLPLTDLEELVALPAHVRVRRALEEMGPCFVKLGQVLATRVDLFSPDWIAEFSRLQNAVPPVAFEDIRTEMIQALGTGLESAFLWLDPEPLAAASIAQVHRARLHDGREVVAKVRRPGIRPMIEADLRLLQYAASQIEKKFPDLRRFHPVGVVRQFRASLLCELDLAAECRHAERIAASFIGDDRIVVPSVHWPFTSERMNVQDFVDGIPVADIQGLDAAGVDRKQVARTGAQAVLKMMLEDGFFHADPHPGNVFVLADGRIAIIDFGMVGRLSPARRAEVVSLLFGLVEHDSGRVTEVLLEWTQQSDVDEEQLTADIDAFVDRYHGVPLGQLDLAGMLLEVTVLLRAHRLALPADLALLIKVCLTLEGLGRSLDPDFDMARQAQPFLRRAMAAQLGPRAAVRRGARALIDATGLLAAFPQELRRLLRAVRGGNARLHLQMDQLPEFGRQVSHSANRLAGGLVIAALIIGSSITLTVKGGPTLLGLPFFGLLGFAGASLAGLWLLWSIFRSGGGR